MSRLEVLEPGLASTVQDLGRPGWLRVGVPQGGALDKEALRLANALVGGGPAQAALEIRYLGPSLRAAGGPARVALVGAEASMRLLREGEEPRLVEAWRSVTLTEGDTLKIGPLKGGSTAVLAVAGGVAAARSLDARATFPRGGFGGLEGRALIAGDVLETAETAIAWPDHDLWLAPEHRPRAPRPDPAGAWPVRVVPGPQDDHFSADSLERFFQAEWRVTKDADRMGMRLEGPRLEHREAEGKGFNIVSDGIVEGAIQVPGAGQPILLLADRGTAGGYPKIAVAASVDLPLLGRLSPGDRLRFVSVDRERARAALREREIELQRVVGAIEPFLEPGAIDETRLWGSNLITAWTDADSSD